MEFTFEAVVVEWRGPAPFYFAAIPEPDSAGIKVAAKGIEYWGQVPVDVRVGAVTFSTALFPKDGRYLLPLKAAVRRSLDADVGQVMAVEMTLRRP